MNGNLVTQSNALSERAAMAVPGRVTLRAAADCARFSLRVAPEGREGAGRALGVALAGRIGGLVTEGSRMVACLGPDEWSILAPVAEGNAIIQAFACFDEPHSLVETSHRDVGIEVGGPAAERALAAACALDLAARPDGSATRTIFDKAPIVLVKHDAEHYRIEVWQSFAPHVWSLLEVVCREIALDV